MFDLDQFIEACCQAIQDTNPTATIKTLLQQALLTPDTLKEQVNNRLDDEQFTPLYQSDTLSIMRFRLEPYYQTPIHNHNTWAMIGVYEGHEHNRFYQRTEDGLKLVKEKDYFPGDCMLLDKDTIHDVYNPLAGYTSGIHIYGGDIVKGQRSVWHPETQKEMPCTIERLDEFTALLSQQRHAASLANA